MIYFNEIDPYAAQWLRNLVDAGHLPAAHVDTRSIADVAPGDLAGYTQCHFFAGIGGWSLAARLAGWPDDRPLWTGSCPCQPFSVAGKGGGAADERHLWPEFFRLIRAHRPDVVMGEQVAAAVGKDWLDGVCVDLEGIGYACGAAVVPACAVDAPHRRDRLWFVASQALADAGGQGLSHAEQPERRQQVRPAGDQREAAAQRGGCGPVEHADPRRHGDAHEALCTGRHASVTDGGAVHRRSSPLVHDQSERRGEGESAPSVRGRWPAAARPGLSNGGSWADAEWIVGADGKARRVKPGVRLLAHGVPGRVGQLRAYGNAIVPQVAAEVIRAYMDCEPA